MTEHLRIDSHFERTPSAGSRHGARNWAVAMLALATTAGCASTSAGPADTGAARVTKADTAPARDTPRRNGGACSRQNPFDEAAMRADVAYLASAALEGRVPGTEGDAAARKYVADRFACLGLDMPSGLTGYEQPFVDAEDESTANVLAVIPGSDPSLSGEVVVLSAHTDHLGEGRLGANDDASGIAGLLAIADALTSGSTPPKRTVLLAAFGAEESGFEGSEYFATHPPPGFEVQRIVFSVNMDMIGSYTASGSLWALGAFEGSVSAELVAGASAGSPGLQVGYDEGSDQSDNVTFCTRGIPYVFFWTEDEACYHKTCDTVDRIDVPHMAAAARLTGDTTLAAANAPADLASHRKPGANVCLGE